jgi:ABC-type transport system involved in multi-copper enzyme maturation permease subunit
MAILTIARLTLREASRRRLLIAVAVLTIALGLLSDWGFHRLLQIPCGERPYTYPCPPAEVKLLAATLLILLMFMFSFVLALGAAFVGAPSVANDVESGVVLAILPRPIRRSEVVIGKWLGLSIFLALYATVACGIEFWIAGLVLNYVPPHPVLSVLFILAEGVVVLTLTLLGSTRMPAMTCGIVVLVLFGTAWMGGIVGEVGAAFHQQSVESIGTVSSLLFPTDGMWRGAIYNLQPAAVLAVEQAAGERASANPFFVSSPPTMSYLIWTCAWVAGMLGLAAWSFRRREL